MEKITGLSRPLLVQSLVEQEQLSIVQRSHRWVMFGENGGAHAGVRARADDGICLRRLTENKSLGYRQQWPVRGITGRVRVSCAGVRTAFLPGKHSLGPGHVCEVTVSLLGQRNTRCPHIAMSLFNEQLKPETKQKHSHQNQEEKKPLSSYKVPPVPSTDKA